jgi:hypothetical protein
MSAVPPISLIFTIVSALKDENRLFKAGLILFIYLSILEIAFDDVKSIINTFSTSAPV